MWHRLKAFFKRARSLFHGQRRDAEMEEELRCHLDMQAQEHEDAGMPSDRARREAFKQFGWFNSVKESCREQSAASWIEQFLQDVRYGVRMLGKNPVFTVVAVLTLALGIGANTAIFSVVHAVILKSLPFNEPDRLAVLCESNPRINLDQYTVSLATYLDWRNQNKTFDTMAALATGGMSTLNSGTTVEQVRTAFSSANLFSLLGVQPILGRSFLTEEEQRGRAEVVILGERLWRGSFRGDPSILNQTVVMNGRSFTVVGVMPERLKLFEPSRVQGWEGGIGEVDIWRPLVIWPEKLKWRSMREFLVLGRLKSGVTIEEARQDVAMISNRLGEQFPESNANWTAHVTSWKDEITARSRPVLLTLLAGAGAGLCIAIVNLANLLLARTTARQGEFAVRLALGARTTRLVRQLIAESLLLSFLGTVMGVLFAYWALQGVRGILPVTLPRLDEIRISFPVLAFAAALSLVVSVVLGLVPLVQLIYANMYDSLKRGGRSGDGAFLYGRARSFLVVSEMALVMLLLIGAGLLTRSFDRLTRVDLGFKSDRLAAIDLSLGGNKYTNNASMVQFVERLIPSLRNIPGVESASTVNGLPLDLKRENMDIAVTMEGAAGDPLVAGLRQASPEYFKSLGISLLQGRNFNWGDRLDSRPVAIINESFSRQLKLRNPIGTRITSPDFGAEPCEIIGIVKDVKHGGPSAASRPEVFRPHLQSCFSHLTVVLRGHLNADQAVGQTRRAVAEVDSQVAVYNPRVMDDLVAAAGSSQRFSMLLMLLLAGTALGLGIVGVYGVLSCIIAERTREIGIRMALGAQQRMVLASIIGKGMSWILSGALIGMAGALAVNQVLRNELFEIGPADPLTFFCAFTLLFVVALCACYFPARRASKVDPIIALRCE